MTGKIAVRKHILNAFEVGNKSHIKACGAAENILADAELQKRRRNADKCTKIFRRVYAYLKKRGVSPQIIRSFISAGLLYEDSEHHNCVFVGYDRDGKAAFASLRGTYDRDGSGFKGDAAGSDKSIGFRLPYAPDSRTVYVFEAPIDLMSYCTLHREFHSNALALCCLDDRALSVFLREHPTVRKVVLCLDHDRPGQEAAERMGRKYAAEGYVVQTLSPPSRKDWNAYLTFVQQFRERGR